MPKIINNVRGMLIEEVQNQITANGYENVTIRSIARECGIGLGTFYNYFKSKDMLIATFLLEDWKERIEIIAENTKDEKDPMVTIHALHREISDFIRAHYIIFSSPSAIKSFNMIGPNYHKFIRDQVATPIYTSCVLAELESPEFLSLFAAESLITWTVAKKDYDEIAPIMKKLFDK